MVCLGTISHRCYAGPAAEGVSGAPRRTLRGRRARGKDRRPPAPTRAPGGSLGAFRTDRVNAQRGPRTRAPSMRRGPRTRAPGATGSPKDGRSPGARPYSLRAGAPLLGSPPKRTRGSAAGRTLQRLLGETIRPLTADLVRTLSPARVPQNAPST